MDSWFDRTSQNCKSRKHICQGRKHAVQPSVDLMCKQFIFAIFGNFNNTLSASTPLYIMIDVLLLILSGIFSPSPPLFLYQGFLIIIPPPSVTPPFIEFMLFFFTFSFSYSIFFISFSYTISFFFSNFTLLKSIHFLPCFPHFMSFFFLSSVQVAPSHLTFSPFSSSFFTAFLPMLLTRFRI